MLRVGRGGFGRRLATPGKLRQMHVAKLEFRHLRTCACSSYSVDCKYLSCYGFALKALIGGCRLLRRLIDTSNYARAEGNFPKRLVFSAGAIVTITQPPAAGDESTVSAVG